MQLRPRLVYTGAQCSGVGQGPLNSAACDNGVILIYSVQVKTKPLSRVSKSNSPSRGAEPSRFLLELVSAISTFTPSSELSTRGREQPTP